jgi:hypothetical protein
VLNDIEKESEKQTWIPKFAVGMLVANLLASLVFVMYPTRKAGVLLGVFAVIGMNQRVVQTAMMATLKLPLEVVRATPGMAELTHTHTHTHMHMHTHTHTQLQPASHSLTHITSHYITHIHASIN